MRLQACLIALLAAVPAFAQAPAAPLRLQFFNIKIDWTDSGGEELPSWISGEFHLDAAGKPVGRLVEVDLDDDGTDEDGDPAGFDSWVFESADGGLSDLDLSDGRVSFSAHDPSDKAWSLHVAARCTDSVAGTWTLQALSQEGSQRSVGKNRFPLISKQKDGACQVYPDPGDDTPSVGTAL